jgi:sulfite reductase (NADPH) flavoprotein alpha-component
MIHFINFCRLEELGATRFNPRNDVDLEDWDVINRWFSNATTKLRDLKMTGVVQDYLIDKIVSGAASNKKKKFDRSRPFFARLAVKKILTTLEDKEDKETIHFEFELPPAMEGMQFTVGDSLGVLPTNWTDEVERVISALGADPNLKVKVPSWRHQKDEVRRSSLEIILTRIERCCPRIHLITRSSYTLL